MWSVEFEFPPDHELCAIVSGVARIGDLMPLSKTAAEFPKGIRILGSRRSVPGMKPGISIFALGLHCWPFASIYLATP